MVRDHDIHPPAACVRDLGVAARPAVHRDDQANPRCLGSIQCGQRQAVAFFEPPRHIGQHWDAEVAQGARHHREPRQPVRIKVAEDHDRFAGRAGAADSPYEDARVRQERRILQRGPRVREEPGEFASCDLPACEHLEKAAAQPAVQTDGRERRVQVHRNRKRPAEARLEHRCQDARSAFTPTPPARSPHRPRKRGSNRPPAGSDPCPPRGMLRRTRAAGSAGPAAGRADGLPIPARPRGADWH